MFSLFVSKNKKKQGQKPIPINPLVFLKWNAIRVNWMQQMPAFYKIKIHRDHLWCVAGLCLGLKVWHLDWSNDSIPSLRYKTKHEYKNKGILFLSKDEVADMEMK